MKVEFRIQNKKDCEYAINALTRLKEAYPE